MPANDEHSDAESSVYLDYNATTPVDWRVLEAMSPFWAAEFANAASEHPAGRRARQAVELARTQVAESVGAAPAGVVFTSGSTESINLAIQGVSNALPGRAEVVTFASEHKAVLDTCAWLSRRGTLVEVLPVLPEGTPEPGVLAGRVRGSTTLVSIMAVNNETGVINPVREVAAIAHAAGALVHCDATQALGKIPLSLEALGVDMLSVSSHKAYGPKGVGALVLRREARDRLQAIIHGGGHERGLRSGTLNVPAIVGFGEACAIAVDELPAAQPRMGRCRDAIESALLRLVHGSTVNGGRAPRVSNTTNVRLPGVDAEHLLLSTPGVAASTGSACSASSPAPSHVLLAMGLDYGEAQECLRISVGRTTTADEIVRAGERIATTLARIASGMLA